MVTTSTSNLAYVGRKPTDSSEKRNSDAWFTPSKYVDAARTALGGTIDLDPFSDPEANKVVQARRFLTVIDDALTMTWVDSSGRGEQTCWMNPPYSGKMCRDAVAKLLAEYEAGHISEAVILTNNATEVRWFQALLKKADALCLTNHRIGFWNTDGKAISNNTRGQAFFYLGTHRERFAKEFTQFGVVLTT